MTPPKKRHRARRSASAARECRMPKCRRTTTRPLGYCDQCWDQARRAE